MIFSNFNSNGPEHSFFKRRIEGNFPVERRNFARVAGGIHFFKFLIFDWWAEFGKIRRRVWLDFNSGAILMAVSSSFKVSSRFVHNSLFSLFWIDNEAHLHLSRNSVEQIAGMRDKLIHGYSGVDLGAVWDTTIKNTPLLKVRLQEILKRGGKEMNGVCNSPLRFGATALGRQG